MSSPFSAVKPSLKLADQVASTLETEIRAGRIQASEKLPTEAALAQQFEVSRTVVREAISRLKSLGLVDSRQGSGVYVKAPGIEPLHFDLPHAASREAVMQIVEVRRALESEVAELAAQRRSEADVQAIRDAMQRISEAVQAGRDGAEEDVEFHRAIARAAGNPFLISTLDYLARFLQGATRVTRANEARRSDFALSKPTPPSGRKTVPGWRNPWWARRRPHHAPEPRHVGRVADACTAHLRQKPAPPAEVETQTTSGLTRNQTLF